MSAQTTTGSVATRLTGNRPPSTAGYTSSMKIRRADRSPIEDKVTLAVTLAPIMALWRPTLLNGGPQMEPGQSGLVPQQIRRVSPVLAPRNVDCPRNIAQ